MSENKGLSKLKLAVLDNITVIQKKKITKTRIANTKEIKATITKPIPCYIHMCKFKCLPNIIFTQLRFELFDDAVIAQEWCKSYCVSYEIRCHKTNRTIFKVK